MKYESVMGSCGLACMLCSAKLNQTCKGCVSTKANECQIKACCERLKINGCYECEQFPCEQEMFKNQRLCAFVEVTKEIGVEALVNTLKNNDEKGIKYHTVDGSKGAYDSLESKEKIKELLLMGLEKG